MFLCILFYNSSLVFRLFKGTLFVILIAASGNIIANLSHLITAGIM